MKMRCLNCRYFRVIGGSNFFGRCEKYGRYTEGGHTCLFFEPKEVEGDEHLEKIE